MGIQDQFQRKDAALLDPFIFCNPVAKNGEPVGNPNDHLACYRYDPPGEPVGSVPIQNQFFPNTTELELREPFALCVPSEKRPVGPEPVDHFSVYRASGPDGPSVTVTDQFGSENLKLDQVNLFLVPASKNGEPILDRISHLSCHPTDGGAAPPQVIVDNQFGPQVLELGQAREFCLPTEKLITPGSVNIDHFKCYEATGPSLGADIDWSDQFQGVGVTLLDPFLLCNPADKNGEGIMNTDDHLVCYRANPAVPFEFQTDVVTQFDPGGPVTIFEAFAFCAPSSKTLPPKTPSVSAGGALVLGAALALAAMLSLGLWRMRRQA
ncbi:MAG: hypothetical protein QNK04_10410 [Myxococcota bacterium]|nr:hypothetical protein [Myxococcota bacterium]